MRVQRTRATGFARARSPLTHRPFAEREEGPFLSARLILLLTVALSVACATGQPCISHVQKPVQAPFDIPDGFWEDHSEGQVVLQVVVGTDGRVSSPRVLQSSGPDFSDIAIRSVMKWQYRPVICKGETSVDLTVTVNFRKAARNG
jgi:TonB family protein